MEETEAPLELHLSLSFCTPGTTIHDPGCTHSLDPVLVAHHNLETAGARNLHSKLTSFPIISL